MPRPAPKLTINLVEGSVAIAFSLESARELQTQIDLLMQSLRLVSTKLPAAKDEGDIKVEVKVKAAPQPVMEYQYTGDVFLEIFCNPNIWPTPFAAKVLVTVRDDRIRITTEASLSRLIEDLNQYIEAVS
jgi:hypothetical protein